MASIGYSMAGEGRGHATRVRTMVEALRPSHRVTLFAPGDAHDLLAPHYADTEVEVVRIPGLRFAYAGSRLDLPKTLWDASGYLLKLPRLVHALQRELARRRIDLVVTDFEPTLPRAARAEGVPFVSLDHQHFLTCCDLSALPAKLRRWAWLWGQGVARYYHGQRETIISGFYAPPLKANLAAPATLIGTLLRPEVLQQEPTDDGHLVVYLRRSAPPGLREALRRLAKPAFVYGLGEHPPDGLVRYRPVDQRSFLDDLAGATALLATAGNQVVGEAQHLGKPVLGIPEPGNHEQAINAHFLRAGGGGDAADWRSLDVRTLGNFLERAPEFHARIDRRWQHGNPAALAALARHLPGNRTARTAALAEA